MIKFCWYKAMFFFVGIIPQHFVKASVLRDPFYLEAKKSSKKVIEHSRRTRKYRIEGVMAANSRLAAVIGDGEESVVVEVGDRLGAYTIQNIQPDSVTLRHGKRIEILSLED